MEPSDRGLEKRLPVHTTPASARRISIALCTYNGARFLAAQLDSFLDQTRMPDELVACDDGSTDETLAILTAFRQRAPFPVRVVRNEVRLGSTKNFDKAIRLCTGDQIATSDQDDLWFPQKLALGEAALDVEPRRGLIFTDALVVDEALRPQGHRLWDAIQFGPLARRSMRLGHDFEVLLKQWIVTGATMMFRAAHRTVILPIPENWVHDAWIALVIAAVAPVAFVEGSTMMYRQHAAQQIGGKKLSWRELYARAREIGPPYFRLAYQRFLAAGERLRGFAPMVREPRFLTMMDEKIEHQRRRLAIAECKSRGLRMAWAASEFARRGYWRYSPNYKHFLKDVLF